jgi:hypothetical protein
MFTKNNLDSLFVGFVGFASFVTRPSLVNVVSTP